MPEDMSKAKRPGEAEALKRLGRKLPLSSDSRELVSLAENAGATLEGHVVLADQLHCSGIIVAVHGQIASPGALPGGLSTANDVLVHKGQVVLGPRIRAQPDQFGAKEAATAAGGNRVPGFAGGNLPLANGRSAASSSCKGRSDGENRKRCGRDPAKGSCHLGSCAPIRPALFWVVGAGNSKREDAKTAHQRGTGPVGSLGQMVANSGEEKAKDPYAV